MTTRAIGEIYQHVRPGATMRASEGALSFDLTSGLVEANPILIGAVVAIAAASSLVYLVYENLKSR